MTTPADNRLERQTLRDRLRPWRQLALPVSVCALVALAAGVATWSVSHRQVASPVHIEAPEPKVVVVEPCEPAEPIVMPKPAPEPAPEPEPAAPEAATTPAPRFGPGSCLPRTRGADRAIGPAYRAGEREGYHQLDGVGFVGVSVSPTRHGVFAAWTRHEIYYTDSDGASFRRVLDGPGPVHSAVVDCRGGVYALRGTKGNATLGYADDAGESWRLTPLVDVPIAGDEEVHRHVELFAGGGWVGVAAERVLFGGERGAAGVMVVSNDAGATWRYLVPPDVDGGNEGVGAVAIARNTLRATGFEGDCMYSGSVLFEYDLAAGTEPSYVPLSGSEHLRPSIRGRWAYATETCDAAVCALDIESWDSDARIDELWRPVEGIVAPPADPGDVESHIVAGGRVFARVGPRLYRLRGALARELATDLPDEVKFHAVDTLERLVGLSEDGTIVRWSRRHGLRFIPGDHLGD